MFKSTKNRKMQTIAISIILILLVFARMTSRLYAQEFEILFLFGVSGSGDGQFVTPEGIGVGQSSSIIVSDAGNNRVQVFDAAGAFQFKFGSSGGGDGQFNFPTGIGVDSLNRIIVADSFNHRIQVFDAAGNFLFKFGAFGNGEGQFITSAGVAVDSSDRIIVTDQGNHRIQVFDAAGAFQFEFGSFGSGDGQFNFLNGIAVDSLNRIIVADSFNQRVQVFDATGVFQFKFGSFGSGDGQFDFPVGVAADSLNRIIVSDFGNDRVQAFDASGVFQFKFGSLGTGDGQFNDPTRLAVDGADRIIVPDKENHRVQVLGSVPEEPVPANIFLHGAGSNANPSTLFLDNNPPGVTDPKFKDSSAVQFSGGNAWKQIGIWTAAPESSTRTLSSLGDLHGWVGLKNSDDQGTQFDARAEVYKNGILVASGITRCITGVTRNPNLAKEVSVAFDPFSPSPLAPGDVVSLRAFTRIGTNPDGSKCSGPGGSHNNAGGLRLYFDAMTRLSRFDATFAP